jgi:hypothetical protein
MMRLTLWLRDRLLRWAKAQPEMAEQPAVEKVYPVVRPRLVVLDRPFDVVDWDKLAQLPNKCWQLFEWAGHRIHTLDAKAAELAEKPEDDRARLVYLAKREVYLELMNLPESSANKVAKLLSQTEHKERRANATAAQTNFGR